VQGRGGLPAPWAFAGALANTAPANTIAVAITDFMTIPTGFIRCGIIDDPACKIAGDARQNQVADYGLKCAPEN
jgi:hypothetical protein